MSYKVYSQMGNWSFCEGTYDTFDEASDCLYNIIEQNLLGDSDYRMLRRELDRAISDNDIPSVNTLREEVEMREELEMSYHNIIATDEEAHAWR